MFTNIALYGGVGSILWGNREAVRLRKWRIKRNEQTRVWTLTGVPEHVDAFQARRSPLYFTAPKQGGFWMWGIESLTVDTQRLIATLGPPER